MIYVHAAGVVLPNHLNMRITIETTRYLLGSQELGARRKVLFLPFAFHTAPIGTCID